ncbi:MAG TPA: protein kinase [Thermoanaerobaculales bacterium]|nr:protein kinase [Thermoanaerobaculales bacterium]
MPLAPGSMLGPYRLVGLLGAGGMGEVYRARDERLGRDVAIKVLPANVAADPDRLVRFEREARATAALDHPNILAVYDVGRHDGQPYLVTQLLEGKTLRQAIATGPLPPSKAMELGIQIAQGLGAAHDRGIIHRDLKPSNIFLTSDGRAKILDFGLARLARSERTTGQLGEPPTATDHTLTGALLGTVGYMAPEQVRGVPADNRSDIFSFGCVLYEMLAGRRAFLRNSAVETMGSILHEDPPRLAASGRSIPPVLAAVVGRCLEKRPEDRFQSAHDVALAIEAVSFRGGSSSVRGFARPRRWRRWAAVAAGCGALVLAAAALGRFLARDSLPGFEPRQVTTRPELESQPALSPLGTDIAYVARDGTSSDIWVVDVRGGQPLRLTDDGAANRSPTWFTDGSAVAYISERDGRSSVWKVPRLGGSPLLLLPEAEDPVISPDGTALACSRPDPNGFMRIAVASLATPQQPTFLTGDGDGVWHHQQPAWSPDGRTICYHDQNDLWLVPAQGGAARRLTMDEARDYDPVWSPSGRGIYFASTRQGTRAIWRIGVGSGELSRVTMGTGQEGGPTLTRSGDLLAYSTLAERMSVELVDTERGERARYERGQQIFEPSISPDRSSLVFSSNAEGSFDLWRLPLRNNRPAGDLVRLTEQPGTCTSPAVSPDGRWLAFQRNADGQRDVWVMPATGGAAVNFTDHPAVETCPEWSPEGARLVFVSDRSGIDQAWVSSVRDGARVGEPRRITGVEGAVTSPSWSPDGARIGLVVTSASQSEVWTVAVDGTEPARNLTQGAGAWFVVWSRSTDELLVLGLWGSPQLSIRAVDPRGGPPRAVALATPSESSASLNGGFDASLDGKLLALSESNIQGDVWVLEAKQGRF